MKIAEVKTNGIINKADNYAIDKKTDNTGNGQKINNLPVSTAFNDKKDEAKKEEAPKAETPAIQEEQPKSEEAKPQAGPSKKELKDQLKEQQERKLADTVKMVEALGKKIAQRNKLENTIANIDGFTVAQNNDKDDLASDSRFARCELVISDDDGNEFVTKNPFIIAYVAHEVRALCVEKLKEVEASIVLPF
ncbi:hypothetical protein [Mucilaginibacter sp.]|jgi:hypothetical protein|uniref:hypothetical protein n=1 Tax=Mucilaginibacter sp. TaxID=1882438 RepID=UPI002603604B|nr:hypothetical protein [Mucilaginibacter sp.]MDB4926602.1 hypothetical protein [Mucilaginibacter sp.]